MQDILPSNLRKNFSYLALLAMQHYRLAFQNSFSVLQHHLKDETALQAHHGSASFFED
jgi:hypothetical protein